MRYVPLREIEEIVISTFRPFRPRLDTDTRRSARSGYAAETNFIHAVVWKMTIPFAFYAFDWVIWVSLFICWLGWGEGLVVSAVLDITEICP